METDPSGICAVSISDGDDEIDEPVIISPELKHPVETKITNHQVLPTSNALLASSLRPVFPKPVGPPSNFNLITKVHNVICTVDLGCKLDLIRITLGVRNAEYNPRRFRAVVMRIQEPRTVILIFSTGKLVITGAKCESAAHLSARKCARILQKLGFDVRFINFKIQNMVASCDVRFPINLEGIFRSNYQFCSYEPELFPGLIYRIIVPKVTVLIFVTGKMVLTGAKTQQDLDDCCEFIYPLLRSFRKQ